MRHLSPKSPLRLNNVACAYCHRLFDANTPRESEHVIGRRFVPKGSLAAQWNLIVGACGKCNDEKSELENDVSAIIVRPDLAGRFPVDPRLVAEALRKESARSKRTGKAVRDSAEELTVSGQFMPGFTFSMNLVSGPQVDQKRVYRLAFFHVSAFFYWLTFDKARRRGGALPSTFGPIAAAAQPDWGNAHLVGFQELVSGWPYRIHAIGADGFFKVVIRRSPEQDPPLWAWALEWNKAFRVVGFFGDELASRAACERLPAIKKTLVERGVDPEKGPFETTMRTEIALDAAHDHLFDPPPE